MIKHSGAARATGLWLCGEQGLHLCPAFLELKADQLQHTLRGIILILSVALTLSQASASYIGYWHNEMVIGIMTLIMIQLGLIQCNLEPRQTSNLWCCIHSQAIKCTCPFVALLFHSNHKRLTILQKILCSQLIYGPSFSLQGSALPWSNEAEDNLKSIALHSIIERTAPKEDSSH